MSCCNHTNDQGDHSNHGHNPKTHRWMMILCCVLPIIAVASLLLSGKVTGPAGNSLFILLMLICPLSHMVIMPYMMRRNHKHD